MRPQCVVALPEIVRTNDLGGDPAHHVATIAIPFLQPLLERTVPPVAVELFGEAQDSVADESVGVVQLANGPRIAGAGEGAGIPSLLVGGHRNLVASDVVGMGIAAVLVVGDHHVRPKVADHAHQRLGRLLQRHRCERSFRHRRQRITLGKSGVDKAEPGLRDAECCGRLGHLVATHLWKILQDSRPIHRRIQDVAALATGQCDDEDVVAFGRVARDRRRALAGFIIGMRVNRHQSGHAFMVGIDG